MDRFNRPPRLARALILVATLFAPLAYGKQCTTSEANAAEAGIDHPDSWGSVDLAYGKYGHCDDGGIAEGYSEAVARLLVDRWDTLPDLAALIRRNPPLRGFVLRHIDATLDARDLVRIEALATTSCFPSLKPLCRALKKAASNATR
jgi:hypothetical protein